MEKIFWIDEDSHLWSSERDALRDFGYEVVKLGNANVAFSILSNINDLSGIRLLIMDVMLLAGIQGEIEDKNYIMPTNRSGLVLARKLNNLNPHFGGKILFFSCASDNSHIAEITTCADEIGAAYFPKDQQYRGLDFAVKLREAGLI